MTVKFPQNEADELYHRIYRLIKRRISPHNIAATLNLPVRTVLGVINRLEKTESISEKRRPFFKNEDGSVGSGFLDIYFYTKTRYGIIDMVGYLTSNNTALLQNEISKALASNLKAIAVKMSDTHFLSREAARALLSSKVKFDAKGRFFAILDPSSEIEPALVEFKIENEIPVFGTEHAFEEAAFSKKGQQISRRGSDGQS